MHRLGTLESWRRRRCGLNPRALCEWKKDAAGENYAEITIKLRTNYRLASAACNRTDWYRLGGDLHDSECLVIYEYGEIFCLEMIDFLILAWVEKCLRYLLAILSGVFDVGGGGIVRRRRRDTSTIVMLRLCSEQGKSWWHRQTLEFSIRARAKI